MTHGVVDEREQTLPNGMHIWTVRCECGTEFSAEIGADGDAGKKARRAFRRHLEDHAVVVATA